jgi:heat shock protein HslJ
MKQSFDEFMAEMAEQDAPEMMGGGSDGAQEGTERWIENLDTQDVWEYAEKFGAKSFVDGQVSGMNTANDIMSSITKQNANQQPHSNNTLI